jgi:carbon storage regulator
MLVLTRKKGERVVIGDDIVVTIIDVKGDSVRIGFDAPRGLSVQRAEIVDAVKAANLEAASASSTAGDQLRDLLGATPATRVSAAESAPTPPKTPEGVEEPVPDTAGSAAPTPRRPAGGPVPSPHAPARRAGTDGA